MHKAWFAGLFDGEGCISLTYPARTFRIRVTISNTHKPTVDTLMRFGGSIWKESVRTQRRYKTQLYGWTSSGKAAVDFLKYIYPYTLTRKAQIDVVLWIYNKIPKERGQCRWKGNEHLTKEALRRLNEARKEGKLRIYGRG